MAGCSSSQQLELLADENLRGSSAEQWQQSARCPTAFVTQFSNIFVSRQVDAGGHNSLLPLTLWGAERQVKGCERPQGVFEGVEGIVSSG